MKAPKNKPKSDPVPQGTYPATCYCIVDWGTHLKKSDKFGDKLERQVRFQWEIPSIRVKYTKDDKELDGPKVIGKTYKFSTYKKSALAKHLTAWGFFDLDNLDFKSIIGKSCSLNVAHFDSDDGAIAYVQAIMSREVGLPDLPLENPTLFYSLDEDKLNIPENLYDFMTKAIKESPEYQALTDTPPQQQESQFDGNGGLANPPRTDETGPLPQEPEGNNGYVNPTDDIPFSPCH